MSGTFMPPKEADVQNIISQYGGDSNVMQAMTLLRVGAVEHYLEVQNGRVRENTTNLAKIKVRQDGIVNDIRRQDEIFASWPGIAGDDSGTVAKSALKVMTINLNRTHLWVAIALGILALTAEILQACGVM